MLPTIEIVKQRFYKADYKDFTAVEARKFNELFKKAIIVFIETLAERVHVDTGMSMASILPLAAEVGYDIIISPRREPRKGYTSFTSYFPMMEKGPAEGANLGKDAFSITWGRPGRPEWRFRFEIKVYHWWLHEHGIVPPNEPWNALVLGRIAMINYMKDNVSNYVPRLAEFVKPVARSDF